jgi:hypothetical protein
MRMAALDERVRSAGVGSANSLGVLVICALVVGALGIRLIGIDEPPAGLDARFYTSAVIAHGTYVEGHPGASTRADHIAELNKQQQPLIEPRIMEGLAVLGYRVAGGEHLWIPRLLASLLWLIGGWFLYRIAALLTSTTTAVISLGVYLFLPFAVEASRTFQPDPLMVAAMLAAIYALVRYDLAPSWERLSVAGALAGFAVLVKPGIAAFFIAGVYLALAIARRGIRGALFNWHLPVFAGLAAAPTIVYLAVASGVFATQADAKVHPGLVHTFFFWKNWAASFTEVLGAPGPRIGKAAGAMVAVAAAVGAWMLPSRARALAIGWFAGYVVFGLIFSYHVATHSYYTLPLVPLVALCLGSLGENWVDWIGRRRNTVAWGFASLAASAALLAALIPIARRYEAFPGGPALRRDSPETAARQFARIGRIVHHSSRASILDPGDGLALEYYGALSGVSWPNALDLVADRATGQPRLTVVQRLRDEAQKLGGPPKYFIVTDPPHFVEQSGLVRFLDANAEKVAATSDYRVYRLPALARD